MLRDRSLSWRWRVRIVLVLSAAGSLFPSRSTVIDDFEASAGLIDPGAVQSQPVVNPSEGTSLLPPEVTSALPAPATTTTGVPSPAAPPMTPAPGPSPDPATLASRIIEAENAARDPNTPAGRMGELGLQHQLAYRQLLSNRSWRDAVEAAMPSEELREVFRVNLDVFLHYYGGWLGPPIVPAVLPRWCVVEPPPLPNLIDLYQRAAGADGRALDWRFLAAIHHVETLTGRIVGESVFAIRRNGRTVGFDHVGAMGPFQFMPGTWNDYKYGPYQDPWNLEHAAYVAAAKLWANGGARPDLDFGAAAFAYNPSASYRDAVLKLFELYRRFPESLRIRWGYEPLSAAARLPHGFPINPAIDINSGQAVRLPIEPGPFLGTCVGLGLAPG